MSMTGSGKELLILIPAHNEERNIGLVLRKLMGSEIAGIADVLVINDASTDRTEAIVSAYGVRCITNVFNLGYGASLNVGYKYAVRHDYRYVIQMDADGQHDVCNIWNIYSALKDSGEGSPDIVLASRFMEGSGEYHAGTLKEIAYVWFRFLIRCMTGVHINDPTTGLQGLSRQAVEFYSRYQHFDDRYPDANMVVQMLLLGFRIRQIPALMHERAEGKSMHAGLVGPAVYMIRMTLQLFAVWIRTRLLKMDVKEIALFKSEAPEGLENRAAYDVVR